MPASYLSATLSLSRLSLRSPLAALARRISLALATRRERAQLAQLDASLLADIGLTAQQAQTEAARPLWDVPTHWRR